MPNCLQNCQQSLYSLQINMILKTPIAKTDC